MHLFLDHPAEASERVELALTIAEAQQLPEVLSQALNTKALLRKDHPREAGALMREALAIALEHDLVAAALRAYNNMIVLTEEQELYDEQSRLTQEALDLARRRGHRVYVVTFAGMLCLDLIERGEWDEAFELAAEHLPDTPTSMVGNAVMMLFIAEAALQRGGAETASHWLDLAQPETDSRDYQHQATSGFKRMLVALAEERLEDALDLCRAQIPFLIEHNFVPAAAFTLDVGITTAADLGRPEAVPALLEPFAALTQAQRIRVVDARIRRAEAAVAAAAGERETADEAFRLALAGARNLDHAAVTAPILADYGRWAVASGREEEGAELLAEARELFGRMGSRAWLERLDGARAAVGG